MEEAVLEHQADGTPPLEHLDNIMPLNFGLLQPVDIGARFMAGREEVQRNQLAQQQKAQDQELNALRMQQTRGAISQQERQVKAETATQKTAMFRDRMQRAPNPNAVRELVKMQHADPDLGPILSQTGTLEQALAEVPDDPVQFERYRQQEVMGMSEWMKSQMPKVVGGSIYSPATNTFNTPPKETTTQESLLMQQLGYPLTPQGYQDFINAKKPSTLRSREEEAQAIRIARESRPPAQPRAEQPPVAVVDPVTGKQVYVTREQALSGKMTPASAMEGLAPKEIQAREAKFPAATSAVKTFESSAEKLATDLERLATHPGLSGISGLIYGRTPAVTKDARAAQALYDSIVARGGFQELQNMRASSPTGGALGNVSNQEGQYLRDAFAPINRTQDTADLSRSLREAAGATRSSKQRVREAYDMTYDYKTQGGAAAPAAGGKVVDFGSLK